MALNNPLKEILYKIQEKQVDSFQLIKDFRENKKHTLQTKQRGLYWIWSDLEFKDLKNIKKGNPENWREVPIAELVSRRENLKGICNISLDNKFRIVYNGIGGYHKRPANFGLRERINQEINCNSRGLGTLNLLNRFPESKIDNWGVSYFNFDDEQNLEILKNIASKDLYPQFAKIIETDWRIEFGTPILTRQ